MLGASDATFHVNQPLAVFGCQVMAPLIHHPVTFSVIVKPDELAFDQKGKLGWRYLIHIN